MNYDSLLSDKIKSLKPSGIRKFFDIAATMDDVISLSVGEPDFKTPWRVRRSAITSLEKGRTSYTSNSGTLALREAIATYTAKQIGVTYSPVDEILVTVGGSEAIDLAIRALVNLGDEVLIPEPCFVCYSPITEMAGGVPVPLVTREENGFKLTAENLKSKITDKTKALVLPFPNNPTGAVMTESDLLAIAEVLKGTNIAVISDEIYSELTYGGDKHVSIASLPNMRERVVVINGFSKAFAMTGWRLGYALAPKPILSQMLKLHQFAIMCAPTTSQLAAVTALTDCADDVARMVDEYDMRRRLCVQLLADMGLPCFTPGGAFYVFPNITKTGLTSEEFCVRLINEKKVAVVPGSAFGASGEGYVRISYAYSLKHIGEAMKRIAEFVNQ
ncbi:MAG: aminotransferase class I/II-fold pyridoxal phosphate-dependent enzyme [Oscillospiraceae bacterium]|jgi:aminotransferase|nr:aminotransferase class I/II-fold pyridoxal phosphate-dependent enzyme [Oscillospiraceae bacterium]